MDPNNFQRPYLLLCACSAYWKNTKLSLILMTIGYMYHTFIFSKKRKPKQKKKTKYSVMYIRAVWPWPIISLCWSSFLLFPAAEAMFLPITIVPKGTHFGRINLKVISSIVFSNAPVGNYLWLLSILYIQSLYGDCSLVYLILSLFVCLRCLSQRPQPGSLLANSSLQMNFVWPTHLFHTKNINII